MLSLLLTNNTFNSLMSYEMIQIDSKWVIKRVLFPLLLFLLQILPSHLFPLKAQITNDLVVHNSHIKKHFQTALDSLVVLFDFPGATAAYVLADGTTEAFATGFADLEAKQKMTNQSRMLAASIGKTLVAASVLSLENEGFLCIDDLISKWLGSRTWFSRLPNHDTPSSYTQRWFTRPCTSERVCQ